MKKNAFDQCLTALAVVILSLLLSFSQSVKANEEGKTDLLPPLIDDYLDVSEFWALPAEKATPVSPQWLGPVLPKVQNEPSAVTNQAPLVEVEPIVDAEQVWQPIVAPILLPPEVTEDQQGKQQDKQQGVSKTNTDKPFKPLHKQAVDAHPKRPQIAILIDDLGYNRRGMEGSLALPVEVALAILPETPYAQQTATKAQQQSRITLLHAPMENERELKLGPGGLYAKMSEQELKAVLNEDLDGLPGIQGANNHMGSLLTTKPEAMKWVMEVLQQRSMFFIDSLTSPNSVAEQTAKQHGLKTVRRDVFLDNIRTHQAIDKQFNRLLKLARRHGTALAIGHPYPETLGYLKQRLTQLEKDGVLLVPLSALLK